MSQSTDTATQPQTQPLTVPLNEYNTYNRPWVRSFAPGAEGESFTVEVTLTEALPLRTLVESLNTHYWEGATVKVNGTVAASAYRTAEPFTAYMNGTIAQRVKAKAAGKMNTLYYKLGTTITVEVTP